MYGQCFACGHHNQQYKSLVLRVVANMAHTIQCHDAAGSMLRTGTYPILLWCRPGCSFLRAGEALKLTPESLRLLLGHFPVGAHSIPQSTYL